MNFSVLMSVYGKDNPDYFKQALESVTINQILRPTQAVIVLDGPVTEEIKTIIAQISRNADDIEFTMVEKQKNGGLAAALNSGLSVCKYEWVARMDSDDISVPDRFEKQVSYLNQHPNIQVLGGYIREFEGVTIPEKMTSIRKVPLTHTDIVNMTKTRNPMNHMSIFYSKSYVEKAGKYSENFGKLEDYKLWVDMIMIGATFANIGDILVCARTGDGFIERRSNKREITDWDMLQTYLLKSRMITKRKALINKLYIRAFIYMPNWMKNLAYKTVLRR